MMARITLILLASASFTADARILAGHHHASRNLQKLAVTTENTGDGNQDLLMMQTQSLMEGGIANAARDSAGGPAPAPSPLSTSEQAAADVQAVVNAAMSYAAAPAPLTSVVGTAQPRFEKLRALPIKTETRPGALGAILHRGPAVSRPMIGGVQGQLIGTVGGAQQQQQQIAAASAGVTRGRTPAGQNLAMQQLAISQGGQGKIPQAALASRSATTQGGVAPAAVTSPQVSRTTMTPQQGVPKVRPSGAGTIGATYAAATAQRYAVAAGAAPVPPTIPAAVPVVAASKPQAAVPRARPKAQAAQAQNAALALAQQQQAANAAVAAQGGETNLSAVQQLAAIQAATLAAQAPATQAAAVAARRGGNAAVAAGTTRAAGNSGTTRQTAAATAPAVSGSPMGRSWYSHLFKSASASGGSAMGGRR